MKTNGKKRGRRKQRKNKKLIAHAAFNIKRFRQKAGFTQEQLEDKTGISVSRCENGKNDMTLTTLSIIGKALGKKAWELVK